MMPFAGILTALPAKLRPAARRQSRGGTTGTANAQSERQKIAAARMARIVSPLRLWKVAPGRSAYLDLQLKRYWTTTQRSPGYPRAPNLGPVT
jgi:hypothetical protein